MAEQEAVIQRVQAGSFEVLSLALHLHHLTFVPCEAARKQAEKFSMAQKNLKEEGAATKLVAKLVGSLCTQARKCAMLPSTACLQ